MTGRQAAGSRWQAAGSGRQVAGGKRQAVVSSFTIIKGSLISETYQIFRGWDFSRGREENLRQAVDTNAIGASSTNWLRDVYKVLHRRFEPSGEDRPLVELAQGGCDLEKWRPLLLWHMTRDEFLVRDFLANWLYPQFQEGALRVRTDDLLPYLTSLHAKGLVEDAWSESTLERVASGLLRIAVDFGLMTGAIVREFASYHLPDQCFIYLLHALKEKLPSARQVVHAPDWRMYFLEPDDVERELFRHHQFRRLNYEVAGSLAQLTLPCTTAAAYAREMLS
ncbi:MAG: DUF1819 family protein [Myxococcota bacterium]|nr:DUF1819 family protein [Myxococcota bacterium]